MNKISENIIVTYAKALRRIQTEQVDPYIELIEKELIKLYPELKDREDNALNWAYDILNADSTAEVVETLARVNDIITKERKAQWTCGYCSKNTYNDDSEYLFGTNHIGCALEEDIKNREHSDPDYILDSNLRKINELENELRHTKRDLVNLELKFERLRVVYSQVGYPHEPTN
jgi:hypothetical protein